MQNRLATTRRPAVAILMLMGWISYLASSTWAHPLGNFTINRFARIEPNRESVRIRYVVDLAEIPAFQERQAVDSDGDGFLSDSELRAYAGIAAAKYATTLALTVDKARIFLEVVSSSATLAAGASGLQSLRVECDLFGLIPPTLTGVLHMRFEDHTYDDRIGWRELVVSPAAGGYVFDSSAFVNSITDELKAYPDDLLAAPLDERVAEFSFASGTPPADARPPVSRDGREVAAPPRDRLAELITIRDLTPRAALLGLLLAVALGGLHALSPGHGKTVVGAYLVGSRGTARHAAFLGLTVTITHTAGVFALGVATLVASNYVVPERLFPILSFVSGGLVAGIGWSLLTRRLLALKTPRQPHGHAHSHQSHSHDDRTLHEHDHSHGDHAHDSSVKHSHLPPGGDGSPVTWRSLLALGISGGILPCPSALVVLLAAISLHRVGYGLLLVVGFSVGLAGVLTAVGLAFVYARRFVKADGRFGRVTQVLPIVSALVISLAGTGICYESLGRAGFSLLGFIGRLAAQLNSLFAGGEPGFASAGAIGVLSLGFIFGIKHATEVDHIVAVSAIVSEHRKLSRAAIVGGLWGAGHTFSLVIVGAVVLAVRIAIPERVADWLEFGVALTIVALGVGAVRGAIRRRSHFHVHRHDHKRRSHAHVHFHEPAAEPHSHAITRIGFKPVIVGAMHGLAGSTALTLLLLTQIDSAVLGLLYLFVFGVGSIIGMLLMSSLVGLPFALSARKVTGIHYRLQLVAGCLSVAFGIWYAF